MKVEIITPEAKLFLGESTAVKLPGSAGQFQILEHHAAIISTLTKGEIVMEIPKGSEPELVHESLTTDGKHIMVQVAGGTVELQNNKLIILAE